MFRHIVFLTIVWVEILILGGFSHPGFAQGNYSISLSSEVAADPGQAEVPIYFILNSSSPVGGVDMFLEFDRDVLTCSSIKLLTRFQYVSYDIMPSGKIRLVARRHHPDSTYLAPLEPKTDTLGILRMIITTKDLLTDVKTPVDFFENPLTPFADNRIVKSDSSFVVPPQLNLNVGKVFIRHPLYGDLNDDGYPNTIADIIFFVNFLSGSQKLSSRQRANSDVNKDGVQGNMADFLDLIKAVTEK